MSASVPLVRDAAGRLPVTCWCERAIRYVPAALVGVTTVSCGEPDCRPPRSAA
jgi:hypothetical protein